MATTLALPAIGLLAEAAPVSAAVNDQSVSGVASPIWQPNGPVDALETGNGLIYAGGNFTSVKPGAGQSGSATSRTYLAAFNASSGTLNTAFNVTLNGRIYSLDMSPDNRTLYIGGSFSTVNGTARNKIAAVNATTGALITGFNPNANRPVRSIESTSSTVYLGGDFTTVRNTTQSYLASVSAATGALNTGFAPTFIQRPDSTCPNPPNPNFPCTVTTYTPNVLALALAPDGSRLLVGGNFMGVNGVSSGGMASLDPATAATEPWSANNAAPAGQPINTNCAGRVSDIAVQGTHAYVTGIGDLPGCYEGTYDATISDGSLNWLSSCLGGSEGLTIMNNIIYKGSHQHDCAFNKGGAYGGFVGGTTRTDFLHRYLVAQNLSDGSFVHWTPNTNSSGTAATGPHVMANDGNQIIVGGDFTTVNKVSQTYLTRFVANGDQATPTVPGRSLNSDPFGGNPGVLTANLAITVQPTKANTLTVLIPTTDDNDSGTLTYNVYRDNGSTPVATMTAESYFWSRPTLRFDDTGLAAGSTHSYRVSASDGIHTSAKSTAVSGTVASSAPAPYSSAIGDLNPQVWWRLDDSGSSLADSSTTGANAGTAVGGVTTGQPGAIPGNSAVSLNGTDGYLTSSSPFSAPGAFSESVWFKTDTVTGGVLLAQSSIQSGAGGTTDRAIVMDNNGDLAFALAGRGINYRNQTTIWNDGKWHQVVGTYDGQSTITLYVDGQPVGSTVTTRAVSGLANSYLRVGYADMSRLQQLGVFGINFYQRVWPISSYWKGTVDEATAYDYTLSAAQIQSMFASGVGGEGNQPPTAAFSSTTSHLTASFDATESTDDSAIASYDWDFGDSTAHGSGATPSHVYSSGGTYPVTLTVTDSDGVSRSVSHDVTVTAPTSTSTSTIVPAGSTWSWKYDATALPSTWSSRTFDASSWSSGSGVLGFGTNVGVVTNIDTFSTTSQRPLTAYFRRQFQVADASDVVELTLDTRADDGVVVYVNGTEVGRTNMPSGTVGPGTYASGAVSTANSQRPTYTVPASLLVDGTNVIAAETHLNYRGTANATFDLSATITTAD